MNAVEKMYMYTFFAILISYTVYFQFYFYEGFTGKETSIPTEFVTTIGKWLVFPLSVAAVGILTRDLYLRDINNELLWVAGFVFLFYICVPVYFIKHATKPRYQSI